MKRRRVKVFVVSARHQDEVLILEKERDDLPGGGIEPGERPKDTAQREACEELPGAELYGFKRIPRRLVRALGGAASKDIAFFAAFVEFPVDVNGNEVVTVTSEHTGARWEPRENFLNTTAPRSYKLAALVGELFFQELEHRHALQLGIVTPMYEDVAVNA